METGKFGNNEVTETESHTSPRSQCISVGTSVPPNCPGSQRRILLSMDYMDYYSFVNPGGIEGWVGLVGWHTADSLPTKWSPINHRGKSGKVRGPPMTDVPITEQRCQLFQYRWKSQIKEAAFPTCGVGTECAQNLPSVFLDQRCALQAWIICKPRFYFMRKKRKTRSEKWSTTEIMNNSLNHIKMWQSNWIFSSLKFFKKHCNIR